jgi:hypothetical protein
MRYDVFAVSLFFRFSYFVATMLFFVSSGGLRKFLVPAMVMVFLAGNILVLRRL